MIDLSSNRDDLNGFIRFGPALACDVLVVNRNALWIKFTI